LSAVVSSITTPSDGSPTHDAIASGISWMLVINLLQRAIGFARNFALCYFLAESQLGLWGLASSFFVLAAPLAVLGLPGTFGRFVESYRSRGQLSRFLTFCMTIALFGYIILAASLVGFHSTSGHAIFGDAQSRQDMMMIVTALGCIILFNAATEFTSGLRQPKTVSSMHAVNSMAFTCLSLLGLWWIRDWRVLVIAFGVSAVLGLLPAIPVMRCSRLWTRTAVSDVPFWEIAQRVLPFAASVWVINLVLNAFDIVDRYLLLHLASHDSSAELGQALVGQLHSGKLIPTLLSNLAVMLGGIVLPYLVVDWEQGRIERVLSSMRTNIKLGTLFFFGLSVGAMVASPFLFGWVLRGRYADGLAILPMALVACCWMAVATFLNNYFWCAERGRLLGVLTTAALILNTVLCVWLIPRMGLHAALLANLIATGFLVAVTAWTLERLEITLGWPTYLIAATPIALAFGTIPAAIVGTILVLVASRTSWLLNAEEKQSIDAVVVPILQRLGLRVSTVWAC
jgi:polysaccharide transporter, PST family